MDEASFVHHIRANPTDEFARLIYADYLEERGDPRGSLIRTQCELARLDVEDPLLPELAARETELLAMHGEEWLAPLRALGAIGISARCFRGGLIERIVIDAADFAARAEAICAAEPALHIVQLKKVSSAVRELSKSTFPEQVRCLDLSANGLTDREMRQLKPASWPAQIEDLNLSFNKTGVTDLASMSWPKLRRLSLARNASILEPLIKASMPNLRSLSLQLNSIGSGIRALFAWRQMAKLEELDLSSTGLSSDDAESLTWSTVLPNVKRLYLRANHIGLRGLRTLAKQRDWNITMLDLRGNHLDYAEARQERESNLHDSYGEIHTELRVRYGDALII